MVTQKGIAKSVVSALKAVKKRKKRRTPKGYRYYAESARLAREAAMAEQLNNNVDVSRGSPWSLGRYGVSAKLAHLNPNQAQWENRMKDNYWGAGDYKRSAGKWLARGVGAAYGGARGFLGGGFAGAAIGAQEGYNEGKSFSKFMGWGDYSSNQIISGGEQPISVNRTDRSGDVIIEHTEFISNVFCNIGASGVSPFEQRKYSINPGLPGTFPFLSQLAQNFILYEFNGLIFQYKPTCGETSTTNNALGKVIMVTQYDPTAPDFINTVQMENYDYANSMKPSVGGVHGVETHGPQMKQSVLYIRSGLPNQKDLTECDVGNFYLASEGVPGTANTTVIVGEIWVTYRIKLSRANLYSSLLGYNLSAFYAYIDHTGADVLPLANVHKNVNNTLDVKITKVSTSSVKFTFPSNIILGYYCFDILTSWSAISDRKFTAISSVSNCVGYIAADNLAAVTTINFAPQAATTTTQAMGRFWVKIDAPGNLQASFNLDCSAVPDVASGRSKFWIQQVNGLQNLTTLVQTYTS